MVNFFFILFISTTTKRVCLQFITVKESTAKVYLLKKEALNYKIVCEGPGKSKHIAQQKRIQSSFEYDFNNWHYCCKNATLLLLLIIHRALLYLWQGFMIRFLCCWFMTLVALERLLGLKYCKKNIKFIFITIHMDVEPCFEKSIWLVRTDKFLVSKMRKY